MTRHVSLVLAAMVGMLAAVASPARAQDDQPEIREKEVRVTAEGLNRDDAVQQALRKALEQGAGVQLAAFSEVEDFVLIRDTIYSRADGIVTDYRVVDEREGPGGTVIVTVEATVRNDAVARAWGEVQNVLDQIGRPKMMVVIDEQIDGETQRESYVATRLEEMFTKSGFDLVEPGAVEDIRARERADAERDLDQDKLARLAKEAGAHILIRGTANANRAGIEQLYGVPTAFYNCDCQAKVFWTDTGKLIASESMPPVRRGVRSRREFSPQAARFALISATFPDAGRSRANEYPLAERLYESVMRHWAEQISAGAQIVLEVADLEFRDYLQLKKALETVDNIASVHGDFTKRTGTFRLKAKLSAETLAERLTESPFDEWLEIHDLKPMRIQARGIAEGS